MENKERTVAERAYEIWETEGRADGFHEEHWQRAEEQHRSAHETAEETVENFASSGSEAKPDASSDRRPSKSANAT